MELIVYYRLHKFIVFKFKLSNFISIRSDQIIMPCKRLLAAEVPSKIFFKKIEHKRKLSINNLLE